MAAVVRTLAERVTNLRQESIRLTDQLAQTLLTLLDGTRERDEIVNALAVRGAFGDPAAVAMRVDDTPASFARLGLLLRRRGGYRATSRHCGASHKPAITRGFCGG